MASLLAALLDVPRVEFDAASGPHPQIPARDGNKPHRANFEGIGRAESGRKFGVGPRAHVSGRSQGATIARGGTAGPCEAQTKRRRPYRRPHSRGRSAGIRLLVVQLGRSDASPSERGSRHEPSPTVADTPSPAAAATHLSGHRPHPATRGTQHPRPNRSHQPPPPFLFRQRRRCRPPSMSRPTTRSHAKRQHLLISL